MEKALRGPDEKWTWRRLTTPLPGVLIRYLCGNYTAKTIGLGPINNWVAWVFVLSVVYTLRAIDFVPRLLRRKFSVGRLFTRVVGYHVMYQVLMSRTSELALPLDLEESLKVPDPKASSIMQRAENTLTRQLVGAGAPSRARSVPEHRAN